MIAVGMMDKKVTLWQKTSMSDTDYGGYNTNDFSPGGYMWAHVVWKTGEVLESGEQMQNKQICEFYVRNAGIAIEATVEDYILFDDGKFYIDFINVVDGRKKYLKIQGTQVQPKDPFV
jgi:hypothetical protein